MNASAAPGSRRPLGILFFLGFPNPFPGAAWARIGFFAEHLRAKGHRVDVVGVFRPGEGGRGRSTWRGIRLWNLCPVFSVDSAPWRLLNLLLALPTVLPLLLALRPDVVVISVPTGAPCAGVYLAGRLVGARVVIDYRDEWEDYDLARTPPGLYRRAYGLLRDLMTRLYQRSDLVITVTEPLAAVLRARGVSGVKVIPNGADTATFRPGDRATARALLGLAPGDFVAVYSGALRYYRFDVVLRAMAALPAEVRGRVKLLLVGRGPELPRIEALAGALGLGDQVLYAGAREEGADLAGVLSAADVGLVPYDDNPLWRHAVPAKFYEYCACGLPVLATVHADAILARILEESGVGRATPPLDAGALAAALGELMAAPEERRAMGERARALVVERYDRRAIAEALAAELEGLARRVPPPGPKPSSNPTGSSPRGP